jgi:hypothetical protein
LGGGDPTLLGLAGLDADDLVKDMLPETRGEQRVGMAEINPGQTQILKKSLKVFLDGAMTNICFHALTVFAIKKQAASL